MNSVPFYSFSNYGEDAMLSGLMSRLSHINRINLFEKNSYLDIGCYKPILANNTYFLYNMGWLGTLVEPNPSLKDIIQKERPRDQFLPFAVDSTSGLKEFFIFDEEHQCNTLDQVFVETITEYKDIDIKSKIYVESKTLENIIDQHIQKFQSIPMVINVDIEGKDFEVLDSYSFKFRPLFFIIEDEILGSFRNSKTFELMKSKNYELVASNFLTAIYMDKTNVLFNSIFSLGQKE